MKNTFLLPILLLLCSNTFAQSSEQEKITAVNFLAGKVTLPNADRLTIEELPFSSDPSEWRVEAIEKLQGVWKFAYSCSGAPVSLKNPEHLTLFPFGPGSTSKLQVEYHYTKYFEGMATRTATFLNGTKEVSHVSNDKYGLEIIDSKEFFLWHNNDYGVRKSLDKVHFVQLKPTGELALESFHRNDPKCTDGSPIRTLRIKVK